MQEKFQFALISAIVFCIFALRGYTFSSGPNIGFSSSTMIVVAIASVVLFLTPAYFAFKAGFHNSAQVKYLYLLYAMYLISLFRSLLISNGESPMEIIQFIKLTFCMLLWFACSISVNTPKQFYIMLAIVIIASLIPSAYVNYTYLSGSRSQYWRMQGLYSGKNVLGRNISIAIIASCAFWMSARSSFRKILLGGVVAFLMLTLILSGSRGGFLATLAGACSLVLTHPASFRKKSIFTIIVVVALLSFTFYFVREYDNFAVRYMSPLEHTGRVSTYQLSIEQFARNPLTGVGVYNYVQATGQPYPHNILLDIGINAGILGVLSFVAMIFYIVRSSLKYIRGVKNYRIQFLLSTHLGILVVILVSMSFSHTLVSIFTLWIFIAFAGNIIYIARNHENQEALAAEMVGREAAGKLSNGFDVFVEG